MQRSYVWHIINNRPTAMFHLRINPDGKIRKKYRANSVGSNGEEGVGNTLEECVENFLKDACIRSQGVKIPVFIDDIPTEDNINFNKLYMYDFIDLGEENA